MNPDSIYRHIGGVIKTRRNSLKPRLTQESLARRLNVSRASLANIETGRQSVMVHQLYTFAKALDLAPSDFLPSFERGQSPEQGQLLAENVMPGNLKPEQRQQIARLLAGTGEPTTRDKAGTHVKHTKR